MSETETSGTTQAVVIERTFDAPVELLWQMSTQPRLFAAWYGPDGATVLVTEMDVRAGGRRLVGMEMQTPDGPMRMWFTGTYREVVENERLVYSEYLSDENGNTLAQADGDTGAGHPTTTEVRIELQDHGGRTALRLTHHGIPSDSPGAVGWTMALDKLARAIRQSAGQT